jgi:hypothetical protein
MSQIANIVAFDGAASPVSHTFVPQSVTREAGKITAFYKEANLSVPDAAQGRITLTLEKMKSGNVYKATSRVEIPVMEAIAGNNSSGYTAPPKVAYVDTIETTGYLPDRSTIADRRIVRGISNNVMSGISTTVALVLTGPIAELYDQLVMPS